MSLLNFKNSVPFGAQKAIHLCDESISSTSSGYKIDTISRKKILSERSHACMNIGYAYGNEGKYSEALKNFKEAQKIKEDLGDKNGVSYMYNNIGLIYQMQGNYPEALRNHLSSLKIKEQLGDKLGIASSHSNIGIIYGLMNKYPEALKNFKEANKIYLEVNDQDGIAESKVDIGNAQTIMGDTVSALKNFADGLALFKQLHNKQNIARTFIMMGEIYSARNDFGSSMKNILDALQIFEEIGDQQNVALADIDMGMVLSKQKKYPAALDYLKKGLGIAKEIGSKGDMENAYHELSDIYSANGDFRQGLDYFKSYTAIKDSLINENKTREIGRLEAKGEFDKQQAIGDAIHKNEIEKRDAIALADNKRKNTIIFAVAAGLFLVLIFSFFIYNRFKLTQKQKQIIEVKSKETEEQKYIIEEKQKEIIDSINYAKRIQFTLLAHQELLQENLTEHFVLFMPKDIVSGDFYWATKKEDRFYLAVCDSTGHGVPGAFMSLLNITFLNEAVIEKNISEPNRILDHVRNRLIENISQDGGQDGMDAILICLDIKKGLCTYAAANNAPLIIKKGIPIGLETDKMPVGKGTVNLPFSLFNIELIKGDSIYLYTDGYADQFGGPKGKKFKYKQLEEKLSLICEMPFEKQGNILEKTLFDWKGNFEQVDDICLIGLRI